MKKIILTTMLIWLLALSLIFPIAGADTCAVTVEQTVTLNRLSGTDRYLTARAIAKDGWLQSNYAILACGENYPDALAAAPLAKAYNAPILLTTKNTLQKDTKLTLQDLKVKEVIIVGGAGVIQPQVENDLRNMGINVARLAGADRYETAVKVAEQLGSVGEKEVFIVTGTDYPDALSAAPIAAKKNIPVLLVPKDTVPVSVQNYLASYSISKSYVIGGEDILSNKVTNQLPNPQRITGGDMYERNIAVLRQFESDLAQDTFCLATGSAYADALSGAAYAAKKSAPIVLVQSQVPSPTREYVQKRLVSAQVSGSAIVFGGTGAVSSSVLRQLGMISNSLPPSHLSKIAAGLCFSAAVKNDGTVWTWGSNSSGKLGIGKDDIFIAMGPTMVKDLDDVISVSAGTAHVLALKNDGTVCAWGFNGSGQLGDGSNVKSNIPVQVKGLTDVISVSARSSMSMALKKDGTLWVWGAADYSIKGSNIPVQVKELSDISFIGESDAIVVKSDGTVWGWGGNSLGTLGDLGGLGSTSTPVKIKGIEDVISLADSGMHVLALKDNGTIWSWGNNTQRELGNDIPQWTPVPRQIEGLQDIKAVSVRLFRSAALKNDGTVWQWGMKLRASDPNYGPINSIPWQVSDLADIVEISVGEFHTLALGKDGTVWAWGNNNVAQLGNHSYRNSDIPVKAQVNLGPQ